jgi:hypothetical protein
MFASDVVVDRPIAGLPWSPASLRFIRVGRQWLLLCLHHPKVWPAALHRAAEAQ